MIGKEIANYTITRKIGEGGMAEVYYAENRLRKSASVKVLKKSLSEVEGVMERFRNEAEVMVKLNHPNIRQVYDYAEMEGRPAIIMEYLEGGDLSTRMKRGERFSDAQVVKWWNQMADALNYTHQKGVVHRDIKPSNIFIDTEGEVHLLDFGIAKVKESITSTQTGAAMGTLLYMSPEQIDDVKRVDYRTDVYSLAVTFVHLLTGKAPYDATTTSDYQIRKSIVEKPLDLSALPAAWQTFLRPYLAKEREQRPTLVRFSEPGKASAATEETVYSSPQSASAPRQTPGSRQNDLANPAGQESPQTQTITVNGVSFKMIAVQGGTFTMGCTSEQGGDCDGDESPAHRVTLSGYCIGETEVTQTLWKAVMGSNPSSFKGDNLPVEKVSWNAVQEFIRKLNALTGRKFRLPTEAEWEYAARGGVKSQGCKYSGGNNIDDVAWYDGNSGSETHPVKMKRPNELGLYDMSGNVYEWCSDWYGSYGSGAQSNPQGPSSGSFRVLRGGSWCGSSRYCRVSARSYYYPDYGHDSGGFRLVLVP